MLHSVFEVTEISQKNKEFLNVNYNNLCIISENEQTTNKKTINIFESDGLEVEVATIHSIKG